MSEIQVYEGDGGLLGGTEAILGRHMHCVISIGKLSEGLDDCLFKIDRANASCLTFERPKLPLSLSENPVLSVLLSPGMVTSYDLTITCGLGVYRAKNPVLDSSVRNYWTIMFTEGSWQT